MDLCVHLPIIMKAICTTSVKLILGIRMQFAFSVCGRHLIRIVHGISRIIPKKDKIMHMFTNKVDTHPGGHLR